MGKIRAVMCCICLVIVALITEKGSAGAAEQSQKNIKVAVFNDSMYADQDENGIWRGTDVECMISIAQKEGFEVTFIDSTNDPDFFENLQNGTYDVVADVVKTADRQHQYLFTDEVIGSAESKLLVRADDDRFSYGNIEQISDMKIGVLASYANDADFRKWCSAHDVSPEIIEYDTVQEMTADLMAGDIDGQVYTAINNEEASSQVRTILKFLPESYYFAFRKEDVDLKNQIDDGLAQILMEDADYLSNLKNKYEMQYQTNILPFSDEEKKYIEKKKILKIAVVKNDAPYYRNDENNLDLGILPDYYSLLSEETGLKMKYEKYESNQEAIAAVKSGKADVLGLFSGGVISSYQNGLILTDSFASVNSIIVTKKGTELSEIKRISIKKRVLDSLILNINRTFPKAELKQYESASECFMALERGKADAALIGLPSATWQLNQVNANAYSIIPVPGMTSDLCGAVNDNEQLLCSILNKSVEATKGNFSGIVTKDTLSEDDWKTTIARIPAIWIVTVAAILSLLVLGLTWVLILLRNRQKERALVFAAQAETERQRLQVETIQKNTEERNRFFANISHDMRTPLNAVMGFIHLAQKENLELERRKAYLDKAEASSRFLLELINDTLTVSRLSSERLELKAVSCRTSDLVEEVASPIYMAAENKKIMFQVDTSEMEDRWIMADKLNLEKIFLNLLTNAVKYTPEGGHVRYVVIQDGETDTMIQYVVLVEDDGIGIGQEFQMHLFEPFAQEKRHGYEAVGTGLGLSIVKQMVELMGGTITVRSKVGEGSVFEVRLSFEKAKEENNEQKPLKNEKTAYHLAHKNVLLCEDNHLNREIAVALLKEQGMHVVTAENGQIGLDLFLKSSLYEFDLILMDIRMPVMDGYRATREIRNAKREDARCIPVIAMSADAFSEDIQKCMEAGMNGHVAKPVEPDRFFELIEKCCAEANSH